MILTSAVTETVGLTQELPPTHCCLRKYIW